MYIEWYGVCNLVVFSVVEVFVDHDAVYAFHVRLDWCVVYGVESCLFDESGCSLLCCYVV